MNVEIKEIPQCVILILIKWETYDEVKSTQKGDKMCKISLGIK